MTGIDNTPLHNFVKKGDWNAANEIIRENGGAVLATNATGKTVLHVAVAAGYQHIVEKLVNIQNDELLRKQDKDGYTALALVAELNETTKMAKRMVEKNKELLTMKTNDNEIPLLLASAGGHKELTRFLYSKTPKEVLIRDHSFYGIKLLHNCISTKIFDVALNLLSVEGCIPITIDYERNHLMPPILTLANMPSVFRSGRRLLHWWQRAIYAVHPSVAPWFCSCLSREKLIGKWLLAPVQVVLLKIPVIKEVCDTKLDHDLVDQILKRLGDSVSEFDESELHGAAVNDAMLQAAKHGIEEYVALMSARLLCTADANKRDVGHVILNCRERLLKLLPKEAKAEIRRISSYQDASGNNILHQVAELGPSSDLHGRFGGALKMQKEIRWFKEVEQIVHPICKDATNAKGKKPHEVFTESHKGLMQAGEQWAKETAGSFTIVCTLIITIAFAAAFTVPGGNNQTGFPIFLNRTLFEVFIMADAVSLVASSTSVLLSIGIFTQRLTEQDFLTSLPLKLMLNHSFLFISVLAMMVAFCAGIGMMLEGYRNLVIAAISLASVPVVVFGLTQFPFFIKIAMSTIGFKWFTCVPLLAYKMFLYLIKKVRGCGSKCHDRAAANI